MGSGKNASGKKRIVRAPATKFAHLRKKALQIRPPAKHLTTAGKCRKKQEGASGKFMG